MIRLNTWVDQRSAMIKRGYFNVLRVTVVVLAFLLFFGFQLKPHLQPRQQQQGSFVNTAYDLGSVDSGGGSGKKEQLKVQESANSPTRLEREVDDEDEVEEEEKEGDLIEQRAAIRNDRMCILYDRPPRTGSTTISIALKGCLKTRYEQPEAGPRSKRPYHIRNMMRLDAKKVGVYTRHLSFNLSDVESLKQGCEKLLYITSIKPMVDRLWSYAKHRFTRDDHMMTDEKRRNAIEFLGKDIMKGAENYYESYPYIAPDESALNVPVEDRMVPDYVIRSEEMGEDLGKLLEALGCESGFQSKNTRETTSETEDFLQDVKLLHKDRTYVRLSKLAKESNVKGLEKARKFQ